MCVNRALAFSNSADKHPETPLFRCCNRARRRSYILLSLYATQRKHRKSRRMPQSVPLCYSRFPVCEYCPHGFKSQIFQATKAEQLPADEHLSSDKYFKLHYLKGLTFIFTYLYLYSRASGTIIDCSVISRLQ